MKSRMAVQLTAQTLKDAKDKVNKILAANPSAVQGEELMTVAVKWVFCMGYDWSPTVDDLLTYLSQLSELFQPMIVERQIKAVTFNIFFHFEDKILQQDFIQDNKKRLDSALPDQWMFIEDLRMTDEWKQADRVFTQLLDKEKPHGVEILKNIESDVAKWQKHQRAKAAQNNKNNPSPGRKPLPDINTYPIEGKLPVSPAPSEQRDAMSASGESIISVSPSDALRVYYMTVGSDRLCLMPKKDSRTISIIFSSQASNDPSDPGVSHYERVGVWTMVSKYAHLTDRARELTFTSDFSIQEKLSLDINVSAKQLADEDFDRLYVFAEKLCKLKEVSPVPTSLIAEEMLYVLIYLATQKGHVSMINPISLHEMAKIGMEILGPDIVADRLKQIARFVEYRHGKQQVAKATPDVSTAYGTLFSNSNRAGAVSHAVAVAQSNARHNAVSSVIAQRAHQ